MPETKTKTVEEQPDMQKEAEAIEAEAGKEKPVKGQPTKGQRYILDGYLFASRQDYEQAKREAESIAFIRSELDVSKEEELYKTYRKLAAKAEYHTPVGIGFLRELQRHLARREETRKGLPLIPVPASGSMPETDESAGDLEQQMGNRLTEKRIRKELEAAYRGRYRNLWIVSGFLLALVLALFVVTWKDKTIDVEAERERILDEYAGWKEELDQQEADLQRRENALKGQPDTE